MSALRVFWLTLFAVGAAAVFGYGWSGGQPWTAAAFVVFFSSRVWRWTLKHPPVRRRDDDAHARTHQFILVTAAGWLGAGVLAGLAAWRGEGVEWLYVAPFFLVMGSVNLYVALHS